MTEAVFQAINLADLPAPTVLEALSFEDILADMKANAIARMPELEPALGLQSDPMTKLLEVAAYYVLTERARFNNGSRQNMLAFAAGTNLDHLAANLGVRRLVGEDDEAFRARAQLAPEAYSVAGSVGAYVFHASSASTRVRNVTVQNAGGGDVAITILSEVDEASADGSAPQDLLDLVSAKLNADTVRPLTDRLTISSATITPYDVVAELTVQEGPDPEIARTAAIDACRAYADGRRLLGRQVTRSGLLGALHAVGVTNVNLVQPANDIPIDVDEASFMASLTVTVEATSA